MSQSAGLALFCTCFALIPPAGAQTFGSSYSSTAPGDCRDFTIWACPAKAADETARSFKCGKDAPKAIGAGGRAVELATRR